MIPLLPSYLSSDLPIKVCPLGKEMGPGVLSWISKTEVIKDKLYSPSLQEEPRRENKRCCEGHRQGDGEG